MRELKLATVIFLLLLSFNSCGQVNKTNSRLDIEKMLVGKWGGELKDFVKGNVNWARPVRVLFTPQSENILFKNNEKLEYSYRIFILKTDTILERSETSLASRFKESSYSRINFITNDRVRLITLFKMSESQFLDDKNSGFYLTRE